MHCRRDMLPHCVGAVGQTTPLWSWISVISPAGTSQARVLRPAVCSAVAPLSAPPAGGGGRAVDTDATTAELMMDDAVRAVPGLYLYI